MWYADKIKENVRADSELCSETFSYSLCWKFTALARLLTCYSVIKNGPALLMIWSCQNWCNPKPHGWSKSWRAHGRQYTSLKLLGNIIIKKSCSAELFSVMLFHIVHHVIFWTQSHVKPHPWKQYINWMYRKINAAHSEKTDFVFILEGWEIALCKCCSLRLVGVTFLPWSWCFF